MFQSVKQTSKSKTTWKHAEFAIPIFSPPHRYNTEAVAECVVVTVRHSGLQDGLTANVA